MRFYKYLSYLVFILSAVVALLFISACGDEGDSKHIEFTINPEKPKVFLFDQPISDTRTLTQPWFEWGFNITNNHPTKTLVVRTIEIEFQLSGSSDDPVPGLASPGLFSFEDPIPGSEETEEKNFSVLAVLLPKESSTSTPHYDLVNSNIVCGGGNCLTNFRFYMESLPESLNQKTKYKVKLKLIGSFAAEDTENLTDEAKKIKAVANPGENINKSFTFFTQ